MARISRIAFAAFVVACAAPPALAAVFVIESDVVDVNLTPHLEFLADPDGRVDPEDVVSPAVDHLFRPFWDTSVNFGIVETRYWFRVTLVNETAESHTLYLELDNPRLNRVVFMTAPPSGTPRTEEIGTEVPFDVRDVAFRNPAFQVTLEPGETLPCYFSVRNQGSFRFHAHLRDSESFGQYRARSERYAALMAGVLLTMALHSLITYLLLRERGFLLELVLVLSFLLFEMAMDGYAFQLLWPNATWWADRAIVCLVGLCLGWMFLYSRHFLRTRDVAPGIDRWLLVFAAIGFLLVPANLTGFLAVNRISHMVSLMSPPVVIGAAIVCWLRGSKTALVFLGAWAFMLAGILLIALLGLGVLPRSFWAEAALQWGVFAALALLSFALAERVREAERSDRERLEAAVRERTAELEDALANVRTLRGLIPICCVCKKVRDDQGYWNQIESYILKHSEADLTHGICPDCASTLYGDEEKGR